MTGCPRAPGGGEALEAFVAGALHPAQAIRVRAHVASCPRCAEEVRWLRAEARLFGARADAPVAPPPPFAAVCEAVRRDGIPWWSLRRVPWPALVAAAAVAALFVTRRPPVALEAPGDPGAAFACRDDRGVVAGEPASREVDPAFETGEAQRTPHAFASADDRYGACLNATPFSPPSKPAPGAGAPPFDTEMTCGGVDRSCSAPAGGSAGTPASLDDEAFDESVAVTR